MWKCLKKHFWQYSNWISGLQSSINEIVAVNHKTKRHQRADQLSFVFFCFKKLFLLKSLICNLDGNLYCVFFERYLAFGLANAFFLSGIVFFECRDFRVSLQLVDNTN
jgi:hypothetical protein